MTAEDEKKTDEAASTETGGEDIQNDEIIDMKEAIKILDTTRSTFYRWLRSGQIKGMKVGRRWRFYREDIERFLKGQEPRIDVPVNIHPLVEALRERAEQLGVETTSPDQPVPQPVVEAVNLMIHLAARMNASDIHLANYIKESSLDTSVVLLRYRVDGTLHTIVEFDPRLLTAIIVRWKILAGCDVGERKKPQDGRMTVKIEGKALDLRVCFLPAGLGESLTVRVLDNSRAPLLNLESLGFTPSDRERIQRWLESPWGMIVVSGPTGSGKTTVLYAFLNHVARPEVKILTAEAPVEYFLPWAVQVSIQQDAGVTFVSALRAILRSDPDIIMVGEMPDVETLSMAQQCALTGHLLMTTMHASSSAGVLKRMEEMGSSPYLIGESTKLVIAQRLVRKLCPDCSVEQTPSAELLDRVAAIARAGGLDWASVPKSFHEPVGCDKCKGIGYRGRTIIAEALEVTPEIIAALESDASIEEMQTIAVKQGMTTLSADGMRRAALGETSIAEAMRVAGG